MELKTREELESSAPVGLYIVADHKLSTRQYSAALDTFGPARMLARVRDHGPFPHGAHEVITRHDGLQVIYQWELLGEALEKPDALG